MSLTVESFEVASKSFPQATPYVTAYPVNIDYFQRVSGCLYHCPSTFTASSGPPAPTCYWINGNAHVLLEPLMLLNDRWDVVPPDPYDPTFIEDPTPSACLIPWRCMFYRATISGALPRVVASPFVDCYFHVESRIRGSGDPWVEATSITARGYPDSEGNCTTEWCWVPLNNISGFFTLEFRLKEGNEVDFTFYRPPDPPDDDDEG